jgi:hypothetical protein
MSKGMLLWQSILVGLQVLAGGAILGEFAASRWVGLGVLTVGAAQAATTYFQRGLGLEVPK